jgi:acetyl/propionyl-CoA carboxylase alpha subunit
VKLEASYNNRTYPIELETKKSSDPGSRFEIKIQRPDGKQVVPVRVVSRSQDRWTLEIDGRIEDVLISRKREEVLIDWKNRTFSVQIGRLKEKRLSDSVLSETERSSSLTAQMTGKVIAVLANEGEKVKVGQGLAIIEAMKMQNEIRSPKSGILTRCTIREGETVNTGDLLFEID